MKKTAFWLPCLLFTSVLHAQSKSAIGKAEIYPPSLHGQKAAAPNAKIDSAAYTCAYNNAEYGQVVRVINLDAKPSKEVLLTVNDRGPFPEGFVISITSAAARKLGVRPGANPRVKVVPHKAPWENAEKPILHSNATDSGPKTAPQAAQTAKGGTANGAPAAPKDAKSGTGEIIASNLYSVAIKPQDKVGYAIQIGAFHNAGAILDEITKLEKRYPGQTMVAAIHEQKGAEKRAIYKLLVGPFANEKEAETAKNKLIAKGYKKCFRINLGPL